MTKEGEINYASLLSDQERRHAQEKPFSDPGRGRQLQQIGMVIDLLPPAPARVLDVGCGTGWTTEYLHRSHFDVVGVDISDEMIALARAVPNRSDIAFVVSDFESLPELGTFDGALFFDCLHHADDERAALEAVFEVLRPGGRVICCEPGVGHHLTAESIRAMETFGVNEKEMPPAHIIELARSVGYRRTRSFPFPFDLIEQLQDALLETTEVTAAMPTTIRSRVRRALAVPVVRAIGRSPRFPTDDAQFRFLRFVTSQFVDFESTGRGGFTILEK